VLPPRWFGRRCGPHPGAIRQTRRAAARRGCRAPGQRGYRAARRASPGGPESWHFAPDGAPARPAARQLGTARVPTTAPAATRLRVGLGSGQTAEAHRAVGSTRARLGPMAALASKVDPTSGLRLTRLRVWTADQRQAGLEWWASLGVSPCSSGARGSSAWLSWAGAGPARQASTIRTWTHAIIFGMDRAHSPCCLVVPHHDPRVGPPPARLPVTTADPRPARNRDLRQERARLHDLRQAKCTERPLACRSRNDLLINRLQLGAYGPDRGRPSLKCSCRAHPVNRSHSAPRRKRHAVPRTAERHAPIHAR
jgi:hypothetical protein